VKELMDLGLLQGDIVCIDLFMNKEEETKLKNFLNKYSHIKEEDILSTMLYKFMEEYK
jgi:hypothetical protein